MIELLIVAGLVVALLVIPRKLPDAGKNIGRATREFWIGREASQDELEDLRDELNATDSTERAES